MKNFFAYQNLLLNLNYVLKIWTVTGVFEDWYNGEDPANKIQKYISQNKLKFIKATADKIKIWSNKYKLISHFKKKIYPARFNYLTFEDIVGINFENHK